MGQRTVLLLQGSAHRGGAETQLLGLATSLPKRGWRPVVAVHGEGPFAEELDRAGVTVVRQSAPGRLRDPAAVRRLVARASELVADVSPDVIQGVGEKMSVIAAHAGRRCAVPAVAWLHDAPARPTDLSSLTTQAALRLCRPARTVTVSDWMAAAFSRRLRTSVGVVPNGLPLTELPAPGQGRRALLDATGFPSDAVVAVHPGRLQRWKGADVVVRAAAALRDSPLRVAVLGGTLYGRDEGWAGELAALARTLGVDDQVRFLGHRDDALELLSGADVVVHASRAAEPFGMVVLEGMATGRMVVATRTGGPEELLEHGRTGLLVAPDDVAAMTHALERALEEQTRVALGRAALHAASSFDVDRTAAGFDAVWRDIAGVAA